MSTKKISVDQLAAEINEMMAAYSEQVTADTKEAVKEVAKTCRKEIVAHAPVRTGSYKKSWKAEVDVETSASLKFVVYSKNRYQLAHLLEKGHVLRNGGRSRAFPHIEPAQENAEKELLRKIKVVVKA